MAAYRGQANHLPLTPPDSGSGYAYSNMHYGQEYSQMHDYHQGYMAPAAQYTSAYQQSYQQAHLPSISGYYEPVGAPVLPPIRSNAAYDDYQRIPQYDYSREATRPVKEEKPTGGVSAKLDYDMDRMTDFVASTVQHMYEMHASGLCLADIDISRSFQTSTSSSPAFRKWVHQVLSATRLPSATILLSMHYLSDRLKIFPSSVSISENQIYRLLSVALILGSKFLDDNTFINRSWSDVTAIKVTELNQLEIVWLHLIDYVLHVEPSCVESWNEQWRKFDTGRTQERHTNMRLTPLDTSVNRRHESSSRRYSPYPSPYSSTTMSHRTFDSTTSRTSHYNTQYSAVDPWSSTGRQSPYEDYYKRGGTRFTTLNEIDEANRRASEAQYHNKYPQAYHTHQAVNTSYSTAAAPSYVPWEQYGWNNMHRSDCNCTNCAYRAWRPYNYNMGTVMG